MPKVSVIIPTYNRPQLINKAIKSVLDQTFHDLEVIVVDDGIEKRAEAIVSAIADERIRYIKNPVSLGGGGARNEGVRHATGEFVAFLDDDDQWQPEKLEIQIKAMDEIGNSGFCFTAVEKYDGKRSENTSVDESIRDWSVKSLTRFKGFLTSTLLVSRDVFQKIGLFDESFPTHQEADLILRISQAYKGVGINKPLVIMDISPHEHIGGDMKKRILGREKIVAKHMDLISRYPDILAKHYFWLGLLYRNDGRIAEARDAFKKSLRVKWSFLSALHIMLLWSK